MVPPLVERLGENTFSNSGIQSIHFTLNSRLEEISSHLFSNCPKLLSIEIPPSVTDIYENAFLKSGLQSITFPRNSNVRRIGSQVFSFCSDLLSIEIPSSDEELAPFAFNHSGLQSITFAPNSKLKMLRSCLRIVGICLRSRFPYRSRRLMWLLSMTRNCRLLRFQLTRNWKRDVFWG